MIKKLMFYTCCSVLFSLQSCISEITCTIQQNNQVIFSYSSTMPLIIYDFATKSGNSFPANLSKTNLSDRLVGVNGVLIAYTIAQTKDKGSIEVTVQLPSPEKAKELLVAYGIVMNYSPEARSFSWSFKPLQSYLPPELANFTSLIAVPFSQTFAVTLPFRTLKAQNAVVSGNTAVFKKTYTSFDDFFNNALYTVTW